MLRPFGCQNKEEEEYLQANMGLFANIHFIANLQANISLKFCEYSLQNEYFEAS
jgi:hypothetical protein